MVKLIFTINAFGEREKCESNNFENYRHPTHFVKMGQLHQCDICVSRDWIVVTWLSFSATYLWFSEEFNTSESREHNTTTLIILICVSEINIVSYIDQ